jgi:aryl-alcohol dehydrogenase-like predicted oxidoreductase
MISAVVATSMPYVLPHNLGLSPDQFFSKIAEFSKIAAWGKPHCCQTGIGFLSYSSAVQRWPAEQGSRGVNGYHPSSWSINMFPAMRGSCPNSSHCNGANHEGTRREFLKAASAAVVGTAMATGDARAASPDTGPTASAAPATPVDTVDTSKILNYNPRMGYRRLGKTGFMISEVSLGGHGVGWQHLEHAVELGINYVDTNISGECDRYGEAMSKTTSARREKWFIGFASWPEKITEEWEQNLTKEGMMKSIEARLRGYKTDMLDLWRPVGATWGQGQNKIETLLMVSHKALDMVVEVFENARQQGKVRYLGISAHNPKVFRRVLNEYPQFSVIIFPYLFLTKELGGDSLLKLAAEKDVGVIGLKPFGAGGVFGLRKQESEIFTDRRAHAMIKEMLTEKRVAAVIPGIGRREHLDENVRGSYERDLPPTPAEKQALQEFRRNFYACLAPEYLWLHDWLMV